MVAAFSHKLNSINKENKYEQWVDDKRISASTLTVYDWNIKILAATSKEKFYRVRRL